MASSKHTFKSNSAKVSQSVLFQKNSEALTAIPGKIGPYILGDIIGEGAFSVVKEAAHEITKEVFACKIISKKNLANLNLESQFEKEIRIQQRLSHPGIAAICDIFKDTVNYYIIEELCKYGSLYSYIAAKKKLTEAEAKFFTKQLAECLLYIHSNGVAHRDVKPENILVSPDNVLKFIDFGLATDVTNDTLRSTKCGTPSYASPECLQGIPYDAKLSDMWSLGVVIYVMIFGELPWTKKNVQLMTEQIEQGDYFIPPTISDYCREVIQRLLTVDTARRMTDEELLASQWLADTPFQIKEQNKQGITRDSVDEFFDGDTQNLSLIQPEAVGMSGMSGSLVLNMVRKRSFHRATLRASRSTDITTFSMKRKATDGAPLSFCDA